MYLGIDVSTKTGLVLLNEEGASLSKVLRFPDTKGIYRVQLIARAFDQFLDEHDQLDCICIEGYGFASATLSISVEIGVFFRMALHKRGLNWYIVPPSVLKKWGTGKGNSKKPQVAEAVKARWGFEAPSDDVVDAYVLAQMAKQIALEGPAAVGGIERG